MNIVQVLESFIFFYCVFPRDEFHLCHSFGEQVQWFIIKHAIRETLVLWEKKKKKNTSETDCSCLHGLAKNPFYFLSRILSSGSYFLLLQADSL